MFYLHLSRKGRSGLDKTRLKLLCVKKATFFGQRYTSVVLRAPRVSQDWVGGSTGDQGVGTPHGAKMGEEALICRE